MLPYLLAERAPLWDPDLAGAYLGIRHGHTTGHFVRATVEGVALQLSTIVESLDRIAPVTSVRATGGALRSMLWRRVLASAIGRPLTITTGAEGSALGVAALGLVALGRVTDLDAALEALRPALDARPIEIPEVGSPAEIALYKGLRASVPGLLAAYDEVARLFTWTHDHTRWTGRRRRRDPRPNQTRKGNSTMELRQDAAWAMIVPTSMGVRITPENGQPVHSSRTFTMQATSAETNVASIASYLGLPVKVLTTFVKGSPIARIIKTTSRPGTWPTRARRSRRAGRGATGTSSTSPTAGSAPAARACTTTAPARWAGR